MSQSPEEKVGMGTMRTSRGLPLPLASTDVKAQIGGPLAEVEVVQTFVNSTDEAIEATYLFPLPHDAAVHRLRFQIGGRTVDGKVEEKEAARRAYEAARAEGRVATLLEQDRPNLFTMSVANIAPNERIVVTLGYQERLGFDDGEWKFVVPLVAQERYHAGTPTGPVAPGEHAPPTTEVPDAGAIRARRLAPEDNAPALSLSVTLRAGFDVEAPRSPSHRLTVARFGAGSYTLSLDEDTPPNRDFVLTFRAADKSVRPLVYLDRRGEGPGTFLIAITPPSEIDLDKTPPRDVVVLVDCSASMRGGSLPQARRAVRYLLDGLAPSDRAEVIAFDHEQRTTAGVVGGKSAAERPDGPNGATPIAPTSPIPLAPVDEAKKKRIDAFLATLSPRGGSELEPALTVAARALPLPNFETARSRIVVLITDAALGNEGRLLRILPSLLDGARLYVLGIGPAVNRYLVARLAQVGGGASDVLLATEDLETTMSRFRRRVRQGGPVLRDVKLQWDDALVADVYPQPIPDLFGGQPTQIVGRFTGTGKTRLRLTGTTPGGAPFSVEEEVTLPRDITEHAGLERLWGRLRIDSRLDRLRLHPTEQADIRMEVLGLALKYSLVSPYTSFVAIDSAGWAGDPTKRHAPRNVEVALPPVAGHGGHADVAAAADRLDDGAGMVTRSGMVPGASLRAASPMMSLSFAPPSSPAPPPAAPSSVGALLSSAGRTLKGLFASDREEHEDVAQDLEISPERIEAISAKARAKLGKKGRKKGASASMEASFADEPPPPTAMPSFAAVNQGGATGHAPAMAIEPYSKEDLAWARGKSSGELDLVFLVDETGSMGSYIATVQKHILHLIEAIRKAPLCKSLRIALVSYRDHPPQESSFVTRVLPLTSEVEAIKAAVMRMSVSGGGDGPEAVTDGLFELVRLDFRPNAARTVVWIGDAPPHGVEPSGDGFPQGCPCNQHWYTQAESCREMGIVIHAVACMPALRQYVAAEEVYRTVARTARGLYVPLDQAALLVPLITGVAESELDKQRIEAAIAEVIAKHQTELAALDEGQKQARLADLVAGEKLRKRTLIIDENNMSGPMSVRFSGVTGGDVEAALESLRRKGTTTI